MKTPSPSKPPPGPPGQPAGEGRRGFPPVVVIALLTGALVLVAGTGCKRKPMAPEPPAPPPVVETPPSNPPPAAVEAAPTNAVPAPHAPRLQGIVYDPVRPWAIVDGQKVFAGDFVGALRVKSISQTALTLVDTNGATQSLILGQ